ncbi:MAG: tetratricopeptide repeat protein [Planctomycetota bacterium]
MKSLLAVLASLLLVGCIGRTTPTWQAALEDGHAAAESGNYGEAIRCIRRACELVAHDPAAKSDAAACQAQLAIVLAMSGDAVGAEMAWRRAIDGFAATLGADAPELAASCDALSRLVGASGRMAEAEALLRRALAGRSDGVETAYRQAMLADAVRAQGRPNEAAPLYRQAIARWELRPGEEINLAMTLHGLAQCLPVTEARPLLERALKLLEVLPNAAAARAPILDTLASACIGLGDAPAAKAALLSALHIVEPTTPMAALTLRGRLAALDQATGSLQAAGRWQEVITGWETARGKDAPELVAPLFGLADTLSGIGHSTEALAPAERALHILERSGTDRQPYVTALNHMISLCARAGDLRRALVLNETVCQIIERTLGTRDPNLVTALRNGAELQRRAGNAEAATALDRRADSLR